MSEFGRRLKEVRDLKRLDQTAFGALGGVSRNAQSNYESGARSPDTEYLEKLRDHGVDVAYLLTGSPAVEQLSPRESTILRAVRGLEPSRQRALQILLDAFCDRGTLSLREEPIEYGRPGED
ncbi:helix-turn-helix transcriptional regulator [Sphingomonadaceae bacterium G21617-S1]|nr:helix-turn-helix transcriptional regulator [Sphingomonadaceae bacterium G21617-S1]